MALISLEETEVQVGFKGEKLPISQLRKALQDLGYHRANVVKIEEIPNEYMIRIRQGSFLSKKKEKELYEAIKKSLGKNDIEKLELSKEGHRLTMYTKEKIDVKSLTQILESHDLKVKKQPTIIKEKKNYRIDVFLIGVADQLILKLKERLKDNEPNEPKRIEWVGPKAGSQLRESAIKALLYAIAFIMVYIAFRFDLRFVPGAIIAMFHDALITLGIYVWAEKEITLTTIAALLTILGYSINDTIVVYDRLRENIARYQDKSLLELINISTNQMFSRTLVTSGTTLFSVIAFFTWGTPVIKDISFALFCGILIGTYSSIYIAAPITEWMSSVILKKTPSTTKINRNT